ncbi:MAG: hypothetical protein MJZ20_13675 [Bacteroidaceae bacterium]|nr:hypothetical protein [Bacteroidaceae bacterium]
MSDDISIEKFAAFLDGNLQDEDMQEIVLAIDSNKEYSDILDDVIHVDDSVEIYTNQPDILQNEIFEQDFDLPVIPSLLDTSDAVELSIANSEVASILDSSEDDAQIILASEVCDDVDDTNNQLSDELHIMLSDDNYDMEQHGEMIDFGDLA